MISRYQLFIINGYNSHHSIDFDDYYKKNNIIALYMPPYSSYIYQPFDVSYFNLLKAIYNKQIE